MTAGVYAIRNTATGAVYVGSSGSITSRWQEHRLLLKRHRHRNPSLQADYLQFGLAAFTLEVLEELQADRQALQVAEQKWIERLGEHAYNIRRAFDPSLTVSIKVAVPRSLSDRAKAMASRQDRTVQAVLTRAVRLGLDQEEARERIACDAIQAAEGRRHPAQGEAPE